MKTKTTSPGLEAALVALACLAVSPNLAAAADSPKTQANMVAEIGRRE